MAKARNLDRFSFNGIGISLSVSLELTVVEVPLLTGFQFRLIRHRDLFSGWGNCWAIASAISATVGASKRWRRDRSTSKISRSREITLTANRECPPNSKKLS